MIRKLEEELAALTHAARVAHEAATHEENKAEDQYDTRGIEASYLAGAQAKRADEIQRTILYFRNTATTEAKLVRVLSAGRAENYLVARLGGGLSVSLDGTKYLVITPESPLGSELVSAKAGDEVEIDVRGSSRTYAIRSVD